MQNVMKIYHFYIKKIHILSEKSLDCSNDAHEVPINLYVH